MFDFIRNHQRLVMAFMLLLIVPAFAMFGIDGYSRLTGAAQETVAKVAGTSVSRAEWDGAHERVLDNLRRQPGADAAQANTAQARLDTLDSLISERVLMAAATDQHLFPSDARLKRLFDGDSRYAALRNPDGTINKDMLITTGMSLDMFSQRIRQEYGTRQVLAGVALTGYTPPTVAAHALDALLQGREVQFEPFDPKAYVAKVNPTEAEVQAYYKANEALFRAPEEAQIEYAVLDYAALGAGITISDEDARKFYDDKTSGARFATPEERRASHILIKPEGDKSAAARAKAKAQAQALLEQVRKAPATFAEVAKKNSQDAGSAVQGGDLDFFGRGAMVKPFEESAFGMKVGDISDLVESDFGYHIINLTATRGGDKKPFDAVRAEIQAELRKVQLAKEWPTKAEQFNDLAYQNSDSLKPLLDKFKLEKKTATVQRSGVVGLTGPLASAKLREALFSNDAVRNKRNTDAIETAPNQLVVARVLQHQPARVLPFADVSGRARERVQMQQAAALARKDGEARLAVVKAAPATALPQNLVVSRADSQGAPTPLLDAVMRADPAKLPEIAGVDLGDAGYAVIRVAAIKPRPVAPGVEDPMLRQYTQVWSAAETEAYLEALKRRYKSDIKPNAKAAAAAAAASAAGSGGG
jgi:peptidyl-prolyl cis-trans isomerase D